MAEARDIAVMVCEECLFALIVLGVLLLAGVIGVLYLAKCDDFMPKTNHPEPAFGDEEKSS